jgi:hypothetical protein
VKEPPAQTIGKTISFPERVFAITQENPNVWLNVATYPVRKNAIATASYLRRSLIKMEKSKDKDSRFEVKHAPCHEKTDHHAVYAIFRAPKNGGRR